MLLGIFVAFLSLIVLVTLHELGHFILAKKFGVPVEEFGIGFPPRLISKKIGKTVYSLNLLPLGAFVKIYGEEGGLEDSLSFTKKPIWQRALIILGGVLSFWVISIIILSILSAVWGLPTAISDQERADIREPKVQIFEVLSGYPAQKAGFLPLDIILKLENSNKSISPTKVKEIQEFIQENKGKMIEVTVRRGKEEKKIKVLPTPEGKIGIGLVRTGFKKVPWYLSWITGTKATAELTYGIIRELIRILSKLFVGGKVKGIEVRGPIGIGEMMAKSFEIGIVYFLYFLSLISIYLAIFNLLPIPAVDGGRLLFLGIEKIRGKPIAPKIEQKINTLFFLLLITLLIFVTIKDIIRLF